MPKVSVIIPTYNRAGLLTGAVESVLGQTFSDLELIVIDDGSTDQTAALLERLLAGRPNDKERVRYIWQENRGQTVATNRAIDKATGEWIAFLDSDDRWLPDKLTLQFQAIHQMGSRCKACITDAVYLHNPALTKTAFEHVGSPYSGTCGMIINSLQQVVSGWHGMYVQTLIVHKTLLPDIGGFDPTLHLGYDLDFFFRLSARTNICYVNRPLVEIDRTLNRPDGFIERLQDEEFRLKHYQHLYEKWLDEDRRLQLGVANLIRRQLQEVHTKWASWYLLSGDNHSARKAMWSAVRYNVTGRSACKWLLTTLTPKLARRIVVKRREVAPDLVFG
ncbi:MAG TPA: glycosyltransferase family A protein [Terriglobales bacterium]|nr:glycosyltransferase family A protein [Terriglobales bacterium]